MKNDFFEDLELEKNLYICISYVVSYCTYGETYVEHSSPLHIQKSVHEAPNLLH